MTKLCGIVLGASSALVLAATSAQAIVPGSDTFLRQQESQQTHAVTTSAARGGANTASTSFGFPSTSSRQSFEAAPTVREAPLGSSSAPMLRERNRLVPGSESFE